MMIRGLLYSCAQLRASFVLNDTRTWH